MNCYLCQSSNSQKISAKLRGYSEEDAKKRYMLRCKNCQLVYISDTEHITEDFYENSNMLPDEIVANLERWNRLNDNDNQRRLEQFSNLLLNKDILDFGAGAGGFIKRVKHLANGFDIVELDNTLADFLEKEFNKPVYRSIDSIPETSKYDVIFMFHVVEHLKDPALILQRLSAYLKPNGCIIVEVPNADDALISIYDNSGFKNFFYWDCHLFYFNSRTISLLAQKADLEVEYVKQIQRYPLSNTLYWLANDKPGGHHILDFLDSKNLNKQYEASLAAVGKCDTIVAKLKFGLGDEKK